jgi:toxin ParE1/3/4
MTPYAIRILASAERDLMRLFDFIAEHDSISSAVHVLDKLETLIATLTEKPERGAVVRELAQLGISNYRQAFWKPYRVIYQISELGVIVVLVADGRRDMQTILEQRLLEPGISIRRRDDRAEF